MGELTIYDITTGSRRPATQDDIDRMQEFLMKLSLQPEGRIPASNPLFEEHGVKLAIYPNRMRTDGVFVAELKEVKPYAGISGLSGEPIYPSVPDSVYRIGVQLPHAFAHELVRRWNGGEHGQA